MMQRLSLPILLLSLLSSASINAQFKKGTKMPGVTIGSALFNSGKTDYSAAPPTQPFTSNINSFAVNLLPSYGWFVTDKIVVGGRLLGGYAYDKIIDENNSNVTFRKKVEKTLKAGIGAFARNYFSNIGSFLPFAQINLDGGMSNTKLDGFSYATNYKESYSGKSSDGKFFDAGLNIGVTKLLGEQVGIDIYAGYIFSSNRSQFKTTTQRDVDFNGSIDETIIDDITKKTTNHGFSIGVAFQVFLK